VCWVYFIILKGEFMQIKSDIFFIKDVDSKNQPLCLEAILDTPTDSFTTITTVSLCCHPHSLYGGTLSNKVVHTFSKAMVSIGIPCLRFNFRGVGKSSGSYDEGLGEQIDLECAVNHLKKLYPKASVILGGFSFGAFVSIMKAHHLNIQQLISIAPPIKRFDFSNYQSPNCSWLIIQASSDELIEPTLIEEWSKDKPATLIKIENASHFFHGQLLKLKNCIQTNIF
jgi:alpha/beta superfamily hydrolase